MENSIIKAVCKLPLVGYNSFANIFSVVSQSLQMCYNLGGIFFSLCEREEVIIYLSIHQICKYSQKAKFSVLILQYGQKEMRLKNATSRTICFTREF